MAINAGEATIEQLYNKGYIRILSDLYKLTPEQLFTLEKWKEKSVTNFIDSLQKSKSVPFERLLFGIGIRYIGETTAKNLAAEFKNIWALSQAGREELLQTEEVGEKLAESIISYFSNPDNISMLKELQEYGLQMSIDESSKIIESERLAGLTIVISGNFSVSRDRMKMLIESHSGKVASSISKNTTYLLAGEKSGPSKQEKAAKLGVQVISEGEFYDIINK